MIIKKFKSFNESIDSNIFSFLNDFGWFISMNLSKVSTYSSNPDYKDELNKMMNSLKANLINGKNYSQLISDNNILKDPKLVSSLFTQIKKLLEYIEPRIKKYVDDSDTKTIWLSKLNDLKNRYINIVTS